MAWLETCRIDANKQVEHLKGKGKSVREAIRILSGESGIPEATLNNWVYARKRSKPTDIFDFVQGEIWSDLIEKDPEKWDRLSKSVEFRSHSLFLWLWLETEYVLNWYGAAAHHYGKSARITDGWRAGYVRCDCPKCNGKVHHVGQRQNKEGFKQFNYSPEIMQFLTKQGYIRFKELPWGCVEFNAF